MRKLTKTVVNFLKREDGPTATEYAVGIALIALVILGGLVLLGNSSDVVFQTTSTSANSPQNTDPPQDPH